MVLYLYGDLNSRCGGDLNSRCGGDLNSRCGGDLNSRCGDDDFIVGVDIPHRNVL